MKHYISFTLLLLSSLNIYSQACQNNFKFPASIVTAPNNFDTVIISTQNFAGDYAEANQFSPGESYIFTSDSINDVITIRTFDQSTVLAFGPQPLSYEVTTDTALSIHINTPGCGVQLFGRKTSIIHKLIVEQNNVGINIDEPLSTLDINGKLKVADDINDAAPGMIRYNEDTQDFEGYDGIKWRSFTKLSSTWGQAVAPVAVSNTSLIAADGGAFDYFGAEIDIDGDWLAVAATIQDIDGESNQGSVYLYKKNEDTFIFHQKVTSPTGIAFDRYGNGGVDIVGNYLIVGTPNANHENSVGTAEVWAMENDLWSWQTTLGNGNDNNNFHFGGSVAIDGEYAAVTNWDQIQGIDEIHIFKKEGALWNQIDMIITDVNSGFFGADLEWYNGQLFVGDPDHHTADYTGGRVAIYNVDNDNAVLDQSVTNPGEFDNFGDLFGREIDIHSDKMIVGSPGYEVDGVFRSGRAYIYTLVNNTWTLEKILQESPTAQFSDFGSQVSIYANQALVSTIEFQNEPSKSYIYNFNNNDWSLEAVLMDENQATTNVFGTGAEIDENIILIGASRTDINGNQDQGKVHIFCK